ncbi:hypothetical protein [Weissella cibaria]|uniref:hypothetical protein n=2 Tax=Weissella cibaria TaxID=137591 RepID=UPI000FFE09DD|nr:hypothetical protein [Weissella cibaria]QAT26616.1 hypothetical protein EQZ96_11385 [Weissella cibaria]
MMSNNIRIFGSMLVATLGAGLFLMSNNPAHADNVVNDVAVESVDNNSPYGTLDNETIASGRALEKYFVIENNQIRLRVDADTLANAMHVSTQMAQMMIDNTNQNYRSEFSTMGFVGVYINLGPKVRNMGGWAAAAFATGYVGFYLKNFAATPVTAGVAGVVSAGAGAAVKYAVEHGIKRVPVGKNIPGVSLSYVVQVP